MLGIEEDQLGSAIRLEALAGERQTEVFEAWGLEGPGGVDTDMKRFHIGVIKTIALEMPAGDALKALGEAKQARVNRSSSPDDDIASDYCVSHLNDLEADNR